MFTISQLLQIHKFKVGDTLEKAWLQNFYLCSQPSDWMTFLPGFCKDTHQKYHKHIFSSLWVQGGQLPKFRFFSTHFDLLVLLPIYWKFRNFNHLAIIANSPPHTEKNQVKTGKK